MSLCFSVQTELCHVWQGMASPSTAAAGLKAAATAGHADLVKDLLPEFLGVVFRERAKQIKHTYINITQTYRHSVNHTSYTTLCMMMYAH